MIVDDDHTTRTLLEYWIQKNWGFRCRSFGSGEDCLENLDDSFDLVLLDLMMPGIGGMETLKIIKETHPQIPVIILSAQSSVNDAIETLRIGAYDYFTKPLEPEKFHISVKNALQLRELTSILQRLNENVGTSIQFENIISTDGKMQNVFKLMKKVMDNDITVLIQGESGTGKELIARAIHYNGRRKNGPFVVVNCASIPRELLETEMFGHEKGSFTGAISKKIGKFEQADGGTIFLDEVGEIDMSLQAKLLRVLQTKEFDRVGGNESLKIDTRIISATNRDLNQAVAGRFFREDLFYRLSSFPIQIPPLRDRRPDALLLAETFLKRFAETHSKSIKNFSRKCLKMLYGYPWPGNVRELENAIERAVILAEAEVIQETDLPLAVQAYAVEKNSSPHEVGMFSDTDDIVPFEDLKERAIRNALTLTKGNIVEAAKRLQISRATMYRLMEKYEISGNEGG
jgi:two-component system response regulator AtoC